MMSDGNQNREALDATTGYDGGTKSEAVNALHQYTTICKQYKFGSGQTLTTWRDLVGNTSSLTTWIYDNASGALTAKKDAANEQTAYIYNSLGQLKYRDWARTVFGIFKVRTTYGYTAGRLTSKTYNDGTAVSYAYNRRGQLAVVTDAAGTHNLKYSDSGQFTEDNINGLGILTGWKILQSYTDGRRDTTTVINSSTTHYQKTYTYKTEGRLDTITANGHTATYAYHPNSDAIHTVTFNNGSADFLTSTYDLDGAGRTQTVRSLSGTTTISAHAYQYDALNRRTRATRENGDYWKYAYNTRSELTSAVKHLHKPAASTAEEPLAGHQWTYDYDDIGNRTQMKSGGDKDGENLEATTYGDGTKSGAASALNQYNEIDNRSSFDITGTDPDAASVTISNAGTTPTVEAQPESVSPKQRFRFKVPSASTNSAPSWNSVTVNGSTSGTKTGSHYVPSLEEQPQYDKDGNLTADARWTYKWNGENRLIEMETSTAGFNAGVPKQKLQFTYDYIGRRIQKKVYDWNTTTSAYHTTPTLHQKFIYDGWNLILRIDAKTTNTPDQKYYWGTDLSGTEQGAGGVGGLLFTQIPSTSTTYAASYDGNGNVITQIDTASVTEEAHYEYDGFGNVIQKAGNFADANLFQFSTKFKDIETGLTYYGYRYYAPKDGRWLRRDPIEERGGINLFGFIGNTTPSRVDFMGLVYDIFVVRQREFAGHQTLIGEPFKSEIGGAGAASYESAKGWSITNSNGVWLRVPDEPIYRAEDYKVWNTELKKTGTLKVEGKDCPCSIATKAHIFSCLGEATKPRTIKDGFTGLPWGKPNCRAASENALGSCCLKKGSEITKLPEQQWGDYDDWHGPTGPMSPAIDFVNPNF